MAGVNKAIILGHIGKDPEIKYTSSGQAVCRFSVATSKKYTDKSGQRQEKTTWHNVAAWGKLAENCERYLKKGSQVYIEGEIDNRSWEDQDGIKRYITEINARDAQFLSASQNQPAPVQDLPDTALDNDDVPF